MTHQSAVFLFACASVVCAQGVDSILLFPQTPLQIAADPQGNLLVARRIGQGLEVDRYSVGGQLLESLPVPGITPSSVVLACDPAGVLYVGNGGTVTRVGGGSTAGWAAQLPSGVGVAAIGFDPQNNPIVLGGSDEALPDYAVRVLALDRGSGKILANALLAGVLPQAMAVDSTGAVYLAGLSNRLLGYAAKLDSSLRQLYFTYLDSALPDAVAVDSAGNAYIAEIPLGVPALFGSIIHFGAYTLYKLDSAGAVAASAGGGGSAIAFDRAGKLIVTGGEYPATGAFQKPGGPRTDLRSLSVTILDPATLQPGNSAALAQQSLLGASAPLADGSLFVATEGGRILHVSPANPSPPVSCIVNGASYRVEDSLIPGQLLTIFGAGLGGDPLAVYDDSRQLPVESGGTEVHIGGIRAPLLAASSTQINAIVPHGVSDSALIEVVRNGTVLYSWQMDVAAQRPAPLPRFNDDGGLDLTPVQSLKYQGTVLVPPADVWNEDGSHNSASNPARRGSTVTIFATGFGNSGADGAPGDGQPVAAFAGIPVITPYGNLNVVSVSTVAGRTNAVMQVRVAIPSDLAAGVQPFVIGLPASGIVFWSNLLYVAP